MATHGSYRLTSFFFIFAKKLPIKQSQGRDSKHLSKISQDAICGDAEYIKTTRDHAAGCSQLAHRELLIRLALCDVHTTVSA